MRNMFKTYTTFIVLGNSVNTFGMSVLEYTHFNMYTHLIDNPIAND